MKVRFIISLVLLSFISACVGPKVPAYKTKTQSFEWGSAYAWMSTTSRTDINADQGRGHLLLNTTYKKSYLNKNCKLLIKYVSLVETETGKSILNEASKGSDILPITKYFGERSKGQLPMYDLSFSYHRDAFPYDMKIGLELNCDGEISQDVFSKKLQFRMVQPVIWEQ